MDGIKRSYGKLTHVLNIPVDERMRKIADAAKQNQIKFNEWARQKLYQAIHEIEQTLEAPTEDKS